MVKRKIVVSGADLRQYLRAANISQVKAAGLVGVDATTMRRWIAEKQAIPPAMWELLKIKIKELKKDV